MAFDITTFFVGRMLAEREGADTQAANRAGLIGSYLGGLTAVNLLVVREFARRQIPTPAAQLPAPPPDGDDRISALETGMEKLAARQEELSEKVCNLPVGLLRLAVVTSEMEKNTNGVPVPIAEFAQDPDTPPDAKARLCEALTGTPTMEAFAETINNLFEPPADPGP